MIERDSWSVVGDIGFIGPPDGPPKLAGPVLLVDYDERWLQVYRREADRISRVLGDWCCRSSTSAQPR
jgi:hypothetical protein